MGNLFGKHKHQDPRRAITDTDKAVLQLKTQRRQLTAQRTRVEGLIAREIEVAKELIAAKKRERALLALRRKQLREGQLEKIDAYLLNVEQVLANIEAAQRQNRLYDALKQGTVALQALQKEVSLEDVERLSEDTAAAGEAERRMRELLAESLSAEADAAALQELAQLEEAEDAGEAARLPAVPAEPTAALEPKEAAPAAPVREKVAIAEAAELRSAPRAAAQAQCEASAPLAAAAAVKGARVPAAAAAGAVGERTGGEEEQEEETPDLPDAPKTRLEPSEQLRSAAAKRGRALAVEEPLPA